MHLYAFVMRGNKPDDDFEVIERYRTDAGRDQAWAAKKLGITQPYYSKLVRGLVPISGKVRHKAREVMRELPLSSDENQGLGRLEEAVIAALRKSRSFRALIEAALKIHKNE